jgi:hypothetical protein
LRHNLGYPSPGFGSGSLLFLISGEQQRN